MTASVALIAALVAAADAGAPEQRLISGCYVHAFAGEEYRPPMTTYTGPTHEPVFMPEASSLAVGPRAWLLGYGGRYRNERLDLPPRTRVPDLAAIGFDRRVDSFKVVCGDGDAERA